MKTVILNIITAVIIAAGVIIGFSAGVPLSDTQAETLKVLMIIMGCSVIYCFVVGEISRNNSQMDKVWSLLPIVYAWVTACRGGLSTRLVIMAVLVTVWGIRLTINFGMKGAYSIRFWSGTEDYRWVFLRQDKRLCKRWVWAIFDLVFISFIQNALVLAICLPMVACMDSASAVGAADILAIVLTAFFILYETIADAQQMKFQSTKWKMINEGKKLEQLPPPYNRGFNTSGLWSVSRHPNYFAEQAIWISLYIFCIGAQVTFAGIFNWSIFGCLLLVLLFMGSSTFGESISSGKYPEYAEYRKKVSKFFPGKKYRA